MNTVLFHLTMHTHTHTFLATDFNGAKLLFSLHKHLRSYKFVPLLKPFHFLYFCRTGVSNRADG